MSEKQTRPLPFSDDARLIALARRHGTPLFAHDEASYRRQASLALDAPNAFGLTVRYAMKANPHRAVLRVFDAMGIHIDASSRGEVERARAAGIPFAHIQLTSQEVQEPEVLREMIDAGMIYNACSLEQIRVFNRAFPEGGRALGIRANPGLGSGHNNRTNTAGPGASFGIWRDYLDQARERAAAAGHTIDRLHTHVGSGSDWRVWQTAARMTLDVVGELPDVATVNLGGGYKIDRVDPSKSIDMHAAFEPVRALFVEFAEKTGRGLHMEIEPGTFLAAEACILLARVADAVDTGPGGYRFLKIDASMTELLRPMIYGARHPIRLLREEPAEDLDEFVVVGQCCESGDLFTTADGDPEGLATARLPSSAAIGDYVAIMGAGAYGLAMSAKNYNSRPVCAEAMLAADGSDRLISRRQEYHEIWSRETD